MNEKIETMIAQLRPALVMQGRDIAVSEITDQKIAVTLSGFCGGCGCSSEYVDGLREMLVEEFPSHQVEVLTV